MVSWGRLHQKLWVRYAVGHDQLLVKKTGALKQKTFQQYRVIIDGASHCCRKVDSIGNHCVEANWESLLHSFQRCIEVPFNCAPSFS
ncbi:hypothetical protein M758_8G049000 [Ceratodon purpureus]|nr:hypothetical protein M758_8G049000 [Ceratodon purpureus]